MEVNYMVDFKNAIREYYEREIKIINSMDLDEISIEQLVKELRNNAEESNNGL